MSHLRILILFFPSVEVLWTLQKLGRSLLSFCYDTILTYTVSLFLGASNKRLISILLLYFPTNTYKLYSAVFEVSILYYLVNG